MSRKYTNYSADFKSKVVLELLESGLTLNEVASKHKILPKNLQNWKQQFLNNMSLAFDKSSVVAEYKEEISTLKKESDALAKTLGRTIVERDWAVGKLKSLDLCSKKDLLKNSEAIQAPHKSSKPSLNRQISLLGISKNAHYYKAVTPFSSLGDKNLLNAIDEIYTKHPYYGHRRIQKQLQRDGVQIGRKRIRSAMVFMGLKAIYPEPKTTIAAKEHRKYPYLLKAFKNEKRQVVVTEANIIWSTDITYIRLAKGFAYLAAIIDWGTKKVLAWKLSSTMDVTLTTTVLRDALARYQNPKILNSDQGSQYTASEHIKILTDNNIAISMDGKGRSIDNIAIERFWRTLKYEDIYLKNYKTIREARRGITEYINLYNQDRLHSKIDYCTPDEVYYKYHMKKSA